MNNKLHLILKIDLFCAILLLITMVWIEFQPTYGLAALTGVGQFALCFLLFIVTIIILVVIGLIYLIQFLRKRK